MAEAVEAPKRRTGWFVLRAISGKEAKVKEILDAAIRNSDLGKYLLQVLIPTEKVYVTRNGKKTIKERNLYSGYVFVECVMVPVISDSVAKVSTQKMSDADVVAKAIELRKSVTFKLPGEVINELRNTSNVIDFLRGRSRQSEPVVLSREDVTRMLGRADDLQEPSNEDELSLLVGEPVKVIDGPFNSFNGVVKEIYPDKSKIKVEVKIFERPTDVDLDISQVERV